MLLLLDGLFRTLFLRQIRVYADEILPLVFSEVKNFKTAVWVSLSFEFPLNSNEPFASSMDSESSEVAAYPFPSKIFCNSKGCA